MRPLLGYLDALGPQAQTILPLTWFTLGVSVAVCVIIAWLLWVAVRRARANGGALETRAVPIERGANGINWIRTGLVISAIPLLITLVWTMVAIASISRPRQHTELAIDVTPYQWWWQASYPGQEPTESFTTANEIHIPTGVPVLMRLHGGDVIHSFWVPKLAGKTDVIPGQTNLAWLQANQPGRFRGQCSEYCGAQHAGMGFEVVAESPADFEQWRAAQLAIAPPPSTPAQQRGAGLIELLLSHESGTQQGLEAPTSVLCEHELLARAAHLALGSLGAGTLGTHLASGEVNLRLERGHLSASLLKLELIRLWIDEQQRIALLHRLVIGDQYLDNAPIDFRCHGRAVCEDPRVVGARSSIDGKHDGGRQHERRNHREGCDDLASRGHLFTHTLMRAIAATR